MEVSAGLVIGTLFTHFVFFMGVALFRGNIIFSLATMALAVIFMWEYASL